MASDSTFPQQAAPEQYERMFLAACSALGAISKALGLDPNDGGAEPILSAIAALKAHLPQEKTCPKNFGHPHDFSLTDDGKCAYCGVGDEVAQQAAPEQATDEIIAGALFDFMGMLTTRDEVLTLSGHHEAGPAVEAIEAFAKLRGLNLAEANVAGWRTAASSPQQRDESKEQSNG